MLRPGSFGGTAKDDALSEGQTGHGAAPRGPQPSFEQRQPCYWIQAILLPKV